MLVNVACVVKPFFFAMIFPFNNNAPVQFDSFQLGSRPGNIQFSKKEKEKLENFSTKLISSHHIINEIDNRSDPTHS